METVKKKVKKKGYFQLDSFNGFKSTITAFTNTSPHEILNHKPQQTAGYMHAHMM